MVSRGKHKNPNKIQPRSPAREQRDRAEGGKGNKRTELARRHWMTLEG